MNGTASKEGRARAARVGALAVGVAAALAELRRGSAMRVLRRGPAAASAEPARAVQMSGGARPRVFVLPCAAPTDLPARGGSSRQASGQLVRDLERGEVAGRVEVVLAGLVDHAEHPVALGLCVAEDDVDLPPLERGGVALVRHAHHESFRSSGHSALALTVPALSRLGQRRVPNARGSLGRIARADRELRADTLRRQADSSVSCALGWPSSGAREEP